MRYVVIIVAVFAICALVADRVSSLTVSTGFDQAAFDVASAETIAPAAGTEAAQ